ncbi:hypothetical protein [Microscilla marina]|uniref:hypothetical protein n=1 Tax=Microscilla marina TaxID=1027 RepID=UPI0002EA97B0|nr:hypothetical protein [Microscilla marina]
MIRFIKCFCLGWILVLVTQTTRAQRFDYASLSIEKSPELDSIKVYCLGKIAIDALLKGDHTDSLILQKQSWLMYEQDFLTIGKDYSGYNQKDITRRVYRYLGHYTVNPVHEFALEKGGKWMMVYVYVDHRMKNLVHHRVTLDDFKFKEGTYCINIFDNSASIIDTVREQVQTIIPKRLLLDKVWTIKGKELLKAKVSPKFIGPDQLQYYLFKDQKPPAVQTILQRLPISMRPEALRSIYLWCNWTTKSTQIKRLGVLNKDGMFTNGELYKSSLVWLTQDHQYYKRMIFKKLDIFYKSLIYYALKKGNKTMHVYLYLGKESNNYVSLANYLRHTQPGMIIETLRFLPGTYLIDLYRQTAINQATLQKLKQKQYDIEKVSKSFYRTHYFNKHKRVSFTITQKALRAHRISNQPITPENLKYYHNTPEKPKGVAKILNVFEQ